MILHLAVLIPYRSVTDRHTTTAYTTLAYRRVVKTTAKHDTITNHNTNKMAVVKATHKKL